MSGWVLVILTVVLVFLGTTLLDLLFHKIGKRVRLQQIKDMERRREERERMHELEKKANQLRRW